MTARHLVARQTIEITAASRAQAEAVMARTSEAAPALAAAIEQALDALDTGTARVRFDRLVIDIGTGDPARWDSHIAQGVARELGPALTRADAVHGSDGETALALLTAFAATGRMPWWAAVADTPAAAVAALATAGAEPATARRLIASPGAIARLVRQLDAASLSRLARLADPALPETLADDAAAIVVAIDSGQSEVVRHAAVWRAILEAIVAGEPARSDTVDAQGRASPARWHGDRTASHRATPNPASPWLSISQAFRQAVARRLISDGFAAARIDPLASARPADAAVDAALAANDDAAGSHPVLAPVAASPPPDEALPGTAPEAAPGARAGDTPMEAADPLANRLILLARATDAWRPLLTRLAAAAGGLDATARYTATAILDDPAVSVRAPLTALVRHFVAAGALAAGEATPHLVALARATAAAAEAEPHDSVATDCAGLPLLWPFLPALFQNRGLTDADGALPIAARHRAVALLDHLATGADAADETRLVLPKLLAGLDLDAVHDPGAPIDAAEAAACADLLSAVVDQAPAFARAGVPGLRALFLVRPGLLTTRDGHWLLRVERRDHDILLDRLPWPIGWVKLPWMPLPLQIEW